MIESQKKPSVMMMIMIMTMLMIMVMMITVDILFAKGNVKLLTASVTIFKRQSEKLRAKKVAQTF